MTRNEILAANGIDRSIDVGTNFATMIKGNAYIACHKDSVPDLKIMERLFGEMIHGEEWNIE